MKKVSQQERLRLVFVYMIATVAALAISVSAATTISTNVATDGTLSVTGLSTLGQASSTRFSVHDTAYFGGTATTTISSAGNVSIAGTLGVTGASTFTGNVGIATSTPGTKLSVGGDITGNVISAARFVATSSSATSVLNGSLGVGSTTPFTTFGVTGTTTSSAGVIVGINGSAVNQVRFGTCTYNPGAVVTTSGLVTSCTGATGVTPTDKVFVTPVNLELGLVFAGASSTADDAISVMVFNATTTGGITPASKSWYWMAIK